MGDDLLYCEKEEGSEYNAKDSNYLRNNWKKSEQRSGL